MKILYLSCHETLEADELYVLDKLGHEVFSVGHYTDIHNPAHASKEDKLDIKYNPELLERFKKLHNYKLINDRMNDISASNVLSSYLFKINKEFADLFDVFIIAHWEENLTINYEYFKGKPIIMRYIGQPNGHWCRHASLDEITKVAFSDTEKYINRHYNFNSIIHPYVDMKYFDGWVGGDYVLTINKWLKKRGQGSAWNEYQAVTSGFKRRVCGFGNEDIPYADNNVSARDLHDIRKNAGVYFSTCSKPGPFTYSFLEALSTGIPVVTIGPKIGNATDKLPTFEAHKYIENGVNGFWSDDLRELKRYLAVLLEDKQLAASVGKAGRDIIKNHFSLENSSKQWDELLKGL